MRARARAFKKVREALAFADCAVNQAPKKAAWLQGMS